MTKDEIKRARVSLAISTYNRPDALSVCVRSVFSQTVLPMEIIIGDDGSGPETAETIRELQKESPVPIVHVWHEDKGFRLAMMRNKSMARAQGDYIIEIDGDIFLHPRFVEDHLRQARRGAYVKGGRCNLGPELTAAICGERRPRPITPFTKGIEGKADHALRLPWLAAWLAPRYRRHKSAGLGCNMSFFKDDFIALNGYDEFYEGWGGEDGDFADRLQLHGLQKRYLKFAGIVYHLWHEDKYMQNKEKNITYSQRPAELKPVRCPDGVDKYLNPAPSREKKNER